MVFCQRKETVTETVLSGLVKQKKTTRQQI